MAEHHRSNRALGAVPTCFERLAVRRAQLDAIDHVKATSSQIAAAPTITKPRTAVAMRSQRVCMGSGRVTTGTTSLGSAVPPKGTGCTTSS